MRDMPRLAVIVGGDGEQEAVPILIRRIAQLLDPGLTPTISPVLKIPESRLIKENELERAIEFSAKKIGGQGGIFILLDCDDGCPATDGPLLLKRAIKIRKDIPISVVLAKREFESWFLAAAKSLGGQRGLANDLTAPSNPEAIRGAKEWLAERMPPGRAYSPTTDQPALTQLFDFTAARQTNSFDKCYREITQLLQKVK